MDRLDTVAFVQSPEQVRFAFRVAGPARRALAYLVDTLIKGAVLLVLGLVFMATAGASMNDVEGWSSGLMGLVVFAVEWLYHVLFESLDQGRSPGKRALGLRVVSREGYGITPLDALLRNLLRAADILPSVYALGAIIMTFDAEFRRLGDWVAGTIVVINRPLHLAARSKLQPPPSEQEWTTIPASVWLTGPEREALELFVRRLPHLSHGRADELADLVLPRFADRLPSSAGNSPARWLAVLYLRAIGQSPSTYRSFHG